MPVAAALCEEEEEESGAAAVVRCRSLAEADDGTTKGVGLETRSTSMFHCTSLSLLASSTFLLLGLVVVVDTGIVQPPMVVVVVVVVKAASVDLFLGGVGTTCSSLSAIKCPLLCQVSSIDILILCVNVPPCRAPVSVCL